METSAIKQKLSDPDSLESLLKRTLLQNLTREKLEQTVAYLANEGWNRKKFYDVCRYINFNEDLSEEEHDTIGNFLSEIIGFTDTSTMIKFPGEPKNKEDFLKYVYSDWWK